MSRAPAPQSLVQGAVRGWHILLLYLLIWFSMIVAVSKNATAIDPLFRGAVVDLLAPAVTDAIVALVILVVPELRRSIRRLYSRERPLHAGDLALAVALLVAWSYGAQRMLFVFPVVHGHPELLPALGYTEVAMTLPPIYLFLAMVSSMVLAPLGEELIFRGYLMNLWMHRWGFGAGLVLSALAFGLFHLHSPLFGLAHFEHAVSAAAGGAILGLVYARHGSLWASTAVHALYNIVAGPYAAGPLLRVKAASAAGHLSSWIPEMVLAAAFVALAYGFWRRYRAGWRG